MARMAWRPAPLSFAGPPCPPHFLAEHYLVAIFPPHAARHEDMTYTYITCPTAPRSPDAHTPTLLWGGRNSTRRSQNQRDAQ